MHETHSLPMPEGSCPLHVFTPKNGGGGPWPAAIFYMDGLAIRPTLFAMAQRLADLGYLTLLPDLFWRAGPYEPLDPQVVFAAENPRAVFGPLMSSTDNARAAADTGAYLAYLDTRKDFAGGKVGVTGYCMGAGVALSVAGTHPDRIAAAAGFHGGRLATDDPLSPHLLADRIKARVLVAGADDDPSYPPEMAAKLEAALSEAGVDHKCEIYPGALHGWTMPDFPIYNEAAAERHWTELATLFGATLHQATGR